MTAQNRESIKAKRQRPSLLDEVLERRMLLYVLAAGATLAGASGAAQAKVVFTPSNVVLRSGSLQIDLNNDGTTDFILSIRIDNYADAQDHFARGVRQPPESSDFAFYLSASGATASDGMAEGSSSRRAPAAFRNGAKIGRSATFERKGVMASYIRSSFRRWSAGPFADVTQRFLGVRFLINGQIHYGWIGFRSTSAYEAALYGWAYETQPNTPIFAGLVAAIGELEKQPALRFAEPTSLELLAAGHVAVADWRRRNAAVVAPVASPS